MSIYREYDIRGIFEKELNKESVTRIGYALASRIEGEFVAVGYDARSHSPVLFEYLTNGLNAGGKTVLDMGLVPTPVNYFASFQTWDGTKWTASADWLKADDQILNPLVHASSEKFLAEKKLTRRSGADCDS